jgi:hypothetical protein
VATYQSDRIKLGYPAVSGTPWPKITKGQVGAAPADILGGVTLGTNDVIQLFKVSGNGGLFSYDIDLPALDSGAALIMSLTDGTNVLQATFTTGRAGGRLTAGNAAHGTLGDAIDYSVDTLIYLLVTTAGGMAIAPSSQIFFQAMTQND